MHRGVGVRHSCMGGIETGTSDASTDAREAREARQGQTFEAGIQTGP